MVNEATSRRCVGAVSERYLYMLRQERFRAEQTFEIGAPHG